MTAGERAMRLNAAVMMLALVAGGASAQAYGAADNARSAAAQQKCPMRLCLVLDQSASISQDEWSRFTGFAVGLYDGLKRISSQPSLFGAVKFSNSARVISAVDPPSKSRPKVAADQYDRNFKKGTNLAVGIRQCVKLLGLTSGSRPKVISIVSDGSANRPIEEGFSEAREAAKEAKRQGIIINAVGLAPAPGGDKLLQGIANPGLYAKLQGGSGQLRPSVAAQTRRLCDAAAPRRGTTSRPTRRPTRKPTRKPTKKPTRRPTRRPTKRPTARPTAKPTARPTARPTAAPTAAPTEAPTAPTCPASRINTCGVTCQEGADCPPFGGFNGECVQGLCACRVDDGNAVGCSNCCRCCGEGDNDCSIEGNDERIGDFGFCEDSCFPQDARVWIRDPATGAAVSKTLAQTTVGDLFQVVEEDGHLGWSEAIMFPHFRTSGDYPFKQITTQSGAEVTISDGHYIYVGRSADTPFAQRSAVAAREVVAGQYLWIQDPAAAAAGNASGRVTADRVVEVKRVTAEGIISPFTVRGNLVVEGVSASSYVDMVGSEAAMHAVVGVGRWMWSTRLGNAIMRFSHERRAFAEPWQMGIGEFVRKNARKETAANRLTHWLAHWATAGQLSATTLGSVAGAAASMCSATS